VAEQTITQMHGADPMKRLGRPEEVASLAFQATCITGAESVVDGGASQLS
jgi:NAD(P)-dependent dehydrogenase (short-subunit alcohol dehydrogenase family)